MPEIPSYILLALPEILALAGLLTFLVGEKFSGGKERKEGERGKGENLFRVGAILLFSAALVVVLLQRSLPDQAGPFGALRFFPLEADAEGGLLILDPPALLFKGMIALAALIAAWSGGFGGGPGNYRGFLSGLFGAAFAAFLIAGANDLLILWGGTELLFLAGRYAALADPWAERPFYRFGIFFSSISLFGILLFYGLFGTTELFAVAGTLSARNAETVPVNGLLIALLFLLGGSLARIGIALAEVVRGERASSLSFLSLFVLIALAGYALAVRLVLGVFPPDLQGIEIGTLTVVLGSAVGIGCGLLAAGADDPHRRICWAAAAHLGVAMLPLASRSTFGFTAGVTYLGVHLLLSLAVLPGIRGGEKWRGEGKEKNGMFRKRSVSRWGGDLFTGVLLLALAGFPFTGGFLARFFLLDSLLEVGPSPILPLLSGVVVSILLLYAYGRGLHTLYFASGPETPAGETAPAEKTEFRASFGERFGDRLAGPVAGLCGVAAIVCGFPGGFRVVWNFLRSWLSGTGG